MAKTKYNPLQAIQNDPLASLKKATVERADSEASSSVPDAAVHNGRNETRSAEVSETEQKPVQPEGIRLSSAPVKPLS